MQQEFFAVKKERFHLTERQKYILEGSWPKDYQVISYLDENEIASRVESWSNSKVIEAVQSIDQVQGVTISVELPSDYDKYKKLVIYAAKSADKKLWFSISTKKLKERQKFPQYFIDEERFDKEENICQIRGWAVGKEPVSIQVFDKDHREIACDIQRNSRPDVVQMYPEFPVQTKCGFFMELPASKNKVYCLEFSSGTDKTRYDVSMQNSSVLVKKARNYIEKGVKYTKIHGGRALIKKVAGKVEAVHQGTMEYGKWRKNHLPSAKELELQKNTVFEWQPKISIAVPLYKTPEKYLRKLIESVVRQTYKNWELCLSDGSGADSPIKNVLNEYTQKDSRIRVVSHKQQLQISENTNAAIAMAGGEFVGFADHDDELTEWALYECVKALNQDREIQVIYSDEDKMTMDGNKFFQPNFKPDFSPAFLCSVNYICHFFVVSRRIIEKTGVLRSEFDGAQDYDFILRCVETTDRIFHIPQVLYHWRCHENSTSENPESKMYAFEAGRRAVQAHYDRMGIKAEVTKGEYLGLYRTRFLRDEDPMISILIPNKDHIDDLKRCMDSIDQKSTYQNYQYIIIENNSTQEETFEFYKKLEQTNSKVKIVYYQDEFNYSAINNFGAKYADGEYLLLLNNDTQIINEDCLEELLGYCMQEDVGAVGARLYYEDDTIQHAGVVVGFGGIAGHCFVQQPRAYTGYCHRIICAQNYSAVTAACMMVKRSVFEQVGGLTEELKVAFNDIDFCMKIRALGKLIVYNPYAELYHYESKSRGLEDTPEKLERFRREIAVFEKRWPDIFRDGDPYYNPNLTLESQDFSLKRL